MEIYACNGNTEYWNDDDDADDGIDLLLTGLRVQAAHDAAKSSSAV